MNVSTNVVGPHKYSRHLLDLLRGIQRGINKLVNTYESETSKQLSTC